MDLVATIVLAVGSILILLEWGEDYRKDNRIIIFLCGVILFFNLFWIPILCSDYKVDTEIYITNKYGKMVFDKPVEITTTRTYKRISAFFDDTVIKIKTGE